jgi:hypothetical protein
METDLRAKIEKYAAKATQCEEWARQAPDGAQRGFYMGLAEYYGQLASDFRQVLAKRNEPQLVPVPDADWPEDQRRDTQQSLFQVLMGAAKGPVHSA